MKILNGVQNDIIRTEKYNNKYINKLKWQRLCKRKQNQKSKMSNYKRVRLKKRYRSISTLSYLMMIKRKVLKWKDLL